TNRRRGKLISVPGVVSLDFERTVAVQIELRLFGHEVTGRDQLPGRSRPDWLTLFDLKLVSKRRLARDRRRERAVKRPVVPAVVVVSKHETPAAQHRSANHNGCSRTKPRPRRRRARSRSTPSGRQGLPLYLESP